VPGFVRVTLVICVIMAALIGALALFTAAGVDWIERAHPPSGHLVEVEDGRLHLVELGAVDAPPLVLLHGASTISKTCGSPSPIGWQRGIA
jgi:hypothetical protein